MCDGEVDCYGEELPSDEIDCGTCVCESAKYSGNSDKALSE